MTQRCYSLVPIHTFPSSSFLEYPVECRWKAACSTASADLALLERPTFCSLNPQGGIRGVVDGGQGICVVKLEQVLRRDRDVDITDVFADLIGDNLTATVK
jgi:hypothetical protein